MGTGKVQLVDKYKYLGVFINKDKNLNEQF